MARRKNRTPRPQPLAQRNGIDPVRLKLPQTYPADFPQDTAPTIASYLIYRFYQEHPERLLTRIADGEILLETGEPITNTTPFTGETVLWYFRELEPEPPVPTDLPVIFEDEWILAVDKPHFLATTPRGMYVANTALTLLRVSQNNPQLVPAHRLDRPTAGVLIFTKTPEARAPFQQLFQRREVQKTYRAIAPIVPGMRKNERRNITSHIHKERGTLQVIQRSAAECAAHGIEPNARTELELDTIFTAPAHTPTQSHLNPRLRYPAPQQPLGLYNLYPHTGKTHQLRAHMNMLGAPIFGDTMYPTLINTSPDETSLPLQLLAHQIMFTHPLTSENIKIISTRTLFLTPPTLPLP